MINKVLGKVICLCPYLLCPIYVTVMLNLMHRCQAWGSIGTDSSDRLGASVSEHLDHLGTVTELIVRWKCTVIQGLSKLENNHLCP